MTLTNNRYILEVEFEESFPFMQSMEKTHRFNLSAKDMEEATEETNIILNSLSHALHDSLSDIIETTKDSDELKRIKNMEFSFKIVEMN